MINLISENKHKDDAGEEEDIPVLPGFRFRPTDEELVGFYLTKKVKGKLMGSINDLIREVDIYRCNPWDLPELGSEISEKEWYFFCMRERKYRNSTRPNRVSLTGSGFWKATGIDKPIYSDNLCIGLKKSLTYHRGNAGKGTKTEWMMHEFRLPNDNIDDAVIMISTEDKEQAEVWTLCRILKRDVAPRKKHKSTLKQIIHNKTNFPNSTTSETNFYFSKGKERIIDRNSHVIQRRSYDIIPQTTPFSSSRSSLWNEHSCEDQLIRNWDELGSVVDMYRKRL